MKRWLLSTLALFLAVTASAQTARNNPAQVLEVRKIWDAGAHNAFTDLIRWKNVWWCTFREAEHHVGEGGKIRVLTSTDGQEWASAALVSEADVDLRDPKFSITPDGRLMIVCGGTIYVGQGYRGRQSRVLFSNDGRIWTVPVKVLTSGDWLWRVIWHDGKAYGTAYDSNYYRVPASEDLVRSMGEWTLKLFRSDDGIKWDLVGPMEVSGQPNETTVRFLANGDLMAMVRRESGTKKGWVGITRPPFTQWTWHESDQRFGGPNFIQLPNGSLLAGTRDYTVADKQTTQIGWLKPEGIERLATLPSSGDNSYPGLVLHEDVLWVSYYSSHDGKTSIYLAKLKLP